MNNNDDKKLGRPIVFEENTEMKILKDYTTGIYTYKDLAIKYEVPEYKVGTIAREEGRFFHTKRKDGIRAITFPNDKN